MTNGSPYIQYLLVGNTPQGQRLWSSYNYLEIQATRTVNALGTMTFEVPASEFNLTDFPIDGIVELWRAAQGQIMKLFLETLWFIRRRTQVIRNGEVTWKITCYDGLYLLGDASGQRGRLIAYNPYNDFTDKLEETDDMCKEIVRENLGSLASDADRRLTTYLSIQADTSAGPILHKEFSRRNVLSTLQEIARASNEAGTYLAFDIVCLYPPSERESPFFRLEFRTYIGYRGRDHRTSSNDPVLIGPDFGNMDEVELDEDWSSEANYIYVTGQSVEHVQAVDEVEDTSRTGISPFNRREYLINGDQSLAASSLEVEGQAALRENEPRVVLKGAIRDSEQAQFGVEWGWGDYLTAQVANRSFDCRVETISTRVSRDGGEDLQGQIRGENVI